MRAVIQRVTGASVEVNGRVIASIGTGLLVLAGFHRDDTVEELEYIAGKLPHLRIFNDESGTMNLSLADIQGEILVVSQFTLYGDARKGRRPSYSDAMKPEDAITFYRRFVDICTSHHGKVATGEFGAHMDLKLVNSGPVTILLDSRKQF